MTREIVSTPNAPAAIGPYSQGVKASGNFLFCSGQVALLPNGEFIGGDVKTQAEQALNNLTAVLEAAGLTRKNVVKTTIFLSSMAHFADVNEVYQRFFDEDPPARSTFAVSGLPKNAEVEIEAIAVY